MIQHFLEVWLFLAVAFALGCVVGSAFYLGLAATFLAPAQVALARTIRLGLDGVLERFGAAPAWREYRYVPSDELEYDDDEDAGVPALRQRPTAAPATPRRPATRGDGAGGRQAPLATGPVGPTPMRPAALSRPRKGVPDDLQRIRGIGKKTERLLNGLGIYHFGQIAAWTPGEARWISEHLDYPDRIERDDWIGQAVVLASDDAAGVERGGGRRDRLFLGYGDADGGGEEAAGAAAGRRVHEEEEHGSPSEIAAEDADDGDAPPAPAGDMDDEDADDPVHPASAELPEADWTYGPPRPETGVSAARQGDAVDAFEAWDGADPAGEAGAADATIDPVGDADAPADEEDAGAWIAGETEERSDEGWPLAERDDVSGAEAAGEPADPAPESEGPRVGDRERADDDEEVAADVDPERTG